MKGLFWLLGTDVCEDRASDLFTYFLYPAIWKSFLINYSLLESRSFRFSKYNPVARKRESIFFHFLAPLPTSKFACLLQLPAVLKNTLNANGAGENSGPTITEMVSLFATENGFRFQLAPDGFFFFYHIGAGFHSHLTQKFY